MRLAISNIAWDVAEDEAIAGLLRRFGVDAVDIAPGKYFPEPGKATEEDVLRVKHWWLDRGIEITGMQALLFGTTGLNLFGPSSVQDAMLLHLGAVCQIAGGLGAKRLVFGSPKNRDRSGLTDLEVLKIAIPFFHQLGEMAQANDVFICLEPNPRCYGANFMTTSVETAQMVKHVAHPAIKMQLDTGAITINDEDYLALLKEFAPIIGHVHASEPDLLPLGDGSTEHTKIAEGLQQYLPGHVVSIEMLATSNEAHPESIERALSRAVQFYRGNGGGARL